MTNRRAAVTCLAIAATAIAVALTGCGSSHSGSSAASTGQAPATDGKTVVVDHMAFTPTLLTVHVGDTVTWRFQDRFPHSVQGLGRNGLALNSPIFDKGSVWTYTFTSPGSYDYTCPLHSDMHGTIVVK